MSRRKNERLLARSRRCRMDCCFTIFIVPFFLVGFYMFGSGLWAAWRSTRAASWPTALATIETLEIETKSDSEGTSHEVKVQYAYVVDGVAYQGSRIAFGYGASSGRRAHKEIYLALKNAESVSTRYDPADPSVSCLSFGTNRSIVMILVASITWLVFVIGFTVMWNLFSRSDTVLVRNLAIHNVAREAAP